MLLRGNYIVQHNPGAVQESFFVLQKLKSDVSIAKNYLPEKEIKRLERAVSGYFDYIEDLIERENTFTMQEFAASVNEFLSFRKYDILPDGNKGKISQKQAKNKAEAEYDVFNKTKIHKESSL